MSIAGHADGEGFAARASAFAVLHADRATEQLIPNLHARVEMIDAGATRLPVTLHPGRRGDAWVCSPRSTYADCAIEEAARYLPRRLASVPEWLLAPLGPCMSWTGLDRAATINNWLLSTNLYPSLPSPGGLRDLIDEAIARWPRHALWFRSLNDHANADWLLALQEAGCQLVASRQVYLYDDVGAGVASHRDLKRDLSLLRRTPLRHCPDAEITDADYARIARLYEMLYIGKYSRSNPRYGEAFMRGWHRAGLLEFEGFRDDSGELLGVVGLFRQGGTATAPIVGYDTRQPQKLGLYRLLTACAYRRCMRQGWRLNFSAGAAGFKRLRGGIPAIEYSAVHARHLPLRTRAALGSLSLLTRRIGVPLLRRYKL